MVKVHDLVWFRLGRLWCIGEVSAIHYFRCTHPISYQIAGMWFNRNEVEEMDGPTRRP